MEDHPVITPTVYEDPKTGFLLLHLASKPDPEGGGILFLGVDLLRGNKDAICRNYIRPSDASPARRKDIKSALELNRGQMKRIIIQARQIEKLYDQHEICLFKSDMDPDLIGLSDNGCSDLNQGATKND